MLLSKTKRPAIGHNFPCFIVAEIGINHNGELAIAKELISHAASAGCDAVKFQKRTPALCVPRSQRQKERDTPWGRMTYMEYRERMEFSFEMYEEIDQHCQSEKIEWFASCWDKDSVKFIERFEVPCHKIASASLTNLDLIERIVQTNRLVILSTGMSTLPEIRNAVNLVPLSSLVLCHSTSSYPCPPNEINLRMIHTLQKEFGCSIGYSGHELELFTTIAAVAIGACYVERHITLDKTMWGSDHHASLEPAEFASLVRDIRTIEVALGDGIKQVYQSEEPIIERLRTT